MAAAFERNIIVCLESHSSKEFITLKLVNELAIKDPRQTLYISSGDGRRNTSPAATCIEHLTDLTVSQVFSSDTKETTALEKTNVLVSNAETVLEYLEKGLLDMSALNLIVIENCDMLIGKSSLEVIIEKFYSQASVKPKILGLSEPIHGSACPSGQLEAKLQYLERCLYSKIETASDILNVLRYCTRPREYIIQCPMPVIDPLTNVLIELVLTKITFLNEHRYDPSEIYSDDFIDEWKHIPDPKVLPLALLYDFLDILLDLGPLTAEKAALHFIHEIEKFKIKTAYERHFLLLSLVSTAFVNVRVYCEQFFRDLSFRGRCAKYMTPKLKSLLNTIRQFKPKATENGANGDRTVSHRSETARPRSGRRGVVTAKVEEMAKGTPNSKNSSNFQELNEIDALNFKELVKSVKEIRSKVEESPDHDAPAKEVKLTLTQLANEPTTVTATTKPIRTKRRFHHRKYYNNNHDNDTLCGIIFCDSKYTAKALFSVVHDVGIHDPDFQFLNVQYTVEKCTSGDLIDDKEVEAEHRKQEEVLKRFRNRECNLLIGTSILERGIDLPKCNLVVRWNNPRTYNSFVQSKGKASGSNAYHLVMVSPAIDRNYKAMDFYQYSPAMHDRLCSSGGEADAEEENQFNECEPGDAVSVQTEETKKYFVDLERVTMDVVDRLGEYREIEKILMENCYNSDQSDVAVNNLKADLLNEFIEPYRAAATSNCVAGLNNAIHLINNYCAKLPSDTFTKLVPTVRYATTRRNGIVFYQCTIRLPVNSPLKRDIIGLPAPQKEIASRIAALIGVKMLHQFGEIDENLQPIGKEEFRAAELYFKNFQLEHADTVLVKENAEPRPGTTKRRQYYFKKVAAILKDCRPTIGQKSYLYHIKMELKTPIPEEQNTRGRKIYAPEDCPLGFGLLITRKIPDLCSFPIFTRSGEIEVTFVLVDENVSLVESGLLKINHFIRYTFTNVLRLQKYLMFFDETATDNCFFVVPTVESCGRIKIDWKFLDVIYSQPHIQPKFKLDENRGSVEFNDEAYKDAVVMPWYRNQEQPQYFYVAEICRFLSPDSSFPGVNYTTFKEYYFRKYGIEVKNSKQPLLDVDHTSARLNFLTPRYVNRKGVALPTSSEETKKAKRENLEQKQILIPELCTIHPFPASLWRAAVCLPCILYRLNALLVADEIRIQVAHDLGLGQLEMNGESFKWPTLNFGWSLHDMLKKHNLDRKKETVEHCEAVILAEPVENDDSREEAEEAEEEEQLENADNELEIGTWTNEMANNIELNAQGEINSADALVRYGSPTLWDKNRLENDNNTLQNYFSDSGSSFQSDEEDENGSGTFDSYEKMDDVKLRIKFESNNVAEAFESEATIANRNKFILEMADKESARNDEFNMDMMVKSKYFNSELVEKFQKNKLESVKQILETALINGEQNFNIVSLRNQMEVESKPKNINWVTDYFPYLTERELEQYLESRGLNANSKLTVDNLFDLNKLYSDRVGNTESFEISGYGDLFHNFESINVSSAAEKREEKRILLSFTNGNIQKPSKTPFSIWESVRSYEKSIQDRQNRHSETFSFDSQPDLSQHPGPSPSIILQALTMSNANDGINLERLETIGDSFLKFAITTYLYCTYADIHEGKLSHLRSKYVSNLNLYRLGRLKKLGEVMISTKFEPHDNWLPPCYYIPKGLEKVLIEAQIPIFYWNLADLRSLKELSNQEICDLIRQRAIDMGYVPPVSLENTTASTEGDEDIENDHEDHVRVEENGVIPCFIPYNLVNQHSIPDKSIADCVEALIGAYLIECGPRGALLFMAWIGICVLPYADIEYPVEWKRYPGSGNLYTKEGAADEGKTFRRIYGTWAPPKSPSQNHKSVKRRAVDFKFEGFPTFEKQIGYTFNDPLYLLQAMTHASYSPNRLTDCYQRLEYLGDAVLDYLITRHLYEDPRQHSPGALTDLRSALVNNTIFASLAVRHGFHKYFRHLSPGLNEVIDRFVRIQHENGYTLSDEVSWMEE